MQSCASLNIHYTMVDQIDCAIGGLINLLSTRLIRYRPRHICFYVFHVVFTYRANIIDTSVCYTFACYSCFTLHVRIPAHGISIDCIDFITGVTQSIQSMV